VPERRDGVGRRDLAAGRIGTADADQGRADEHGGGDQYGWK
jgi:hypothetical protein